MSKIAACAGLALGIALLAAAFAHADDAPRLRRPLAAVLSADDRLLYVANEQTGSVSIIDVFSGRISAEIAIGRQLVDFTATPDRRTWLALDGGTGELLRLSVDGQKVDVAERLPVDRTAVRVVVSQNGKRAYVSGLWSRRVHVVQLSAPAKVVARIDLEIAPRSMLLVENDARLIVADSFAGQLAVIDTANNTWLHTSEFPAHNIRGLGVSKDGKTLLVAHQMLNELGHTVENDVHWGLVMTNDLRWLPLATIVEGKKDLYRGAHMHPLGEPGRGSADPMGLAVAPDGRVVVALGGVGQISTGRENDFALRRVNVGQRPTHVAISSDSRTAWVVNSFSDSVSRVDLESDKVVSEIALGVMPQLTQAERGEQLFYDARLSLDGWMSCHSCHTDGHTNGQKNDNFSDKTFGAPKRVLSLLTTTDSAPFGWRGTAKDLNEQIEKSIFHTMQGGKPTDEQVTALAAYLKTLAPPPSIDTARGSVDEPAIARGKALFGELKCSGCHAAPAYTTPKLYSVGLKDELDHREFNPPSLLGVGQRAPYFHDGRAKTLEDVFTGHDHQLPRVLDEREVRDLIRFLRSL